MTGWYCGTIIYICCMVCTGTYPRHNLPRFLRMRNLRDALLHMSAPKYLKRDSKQTMKQLGLSIIDRDT